MELTEEQRRRLEENKRRAQERRLAKQNQASQMDDDFDDILGSLGPGECLCKRLMLLLPHLDSFQVSTFQ